MHLTKHTDLSLRVLIYLTLKPDKLCTISEIASSYGANKNHLIKVVHRLAKYGYISSVQGRGGGIRLSRKGDHITVGDVVRNMELSMDVIDCESANCPLVSVCRLKPALDKATSAFLAVLDDYTIKDLCRNRAQLLKLVS